VTAGVTPAERQRDRIALGIFAAGALLYLFAYVGMHRLATVPIVPSVGHPALREFTRLWQLSRLALVIAAIGGIGMLWSFWRWRARPKDVI
jgi:hypothetical protein